jgi:hypothetical protein
MALHIMESRSQQVESIQISVMMLDRDAPIFDRICGCGFDWELTHSLCSPTIKAV